MKFEFGDLYKFFVSLGAVIIAIAILVPWLFLREPFDLLKPESEIKAATAIAQSVILERQKRVSEVIAILPWFSGAGFVLGLGLIWYGICRWGANQKLLDEQIQLDLAIKKQSIRNSSTDLNVETKSDTELSDSDNLPTDGGNKSTLDSTAKHLSITPTPVIHKSVRTFDSAANIETIVTHRLEVIAPGKYLIEQNQIFGGAEIDVLLRATSRFATDCIVEVKHINRGFNRGWLRESFLKNLYAKNLYTQATNRSPDTILLVVMNSDIEITERHRALANDVSADKFARAGKDRIVLISLKDLIGLSPESLQKRLGL